MFDIRAFNRFLFCSFKKARFQSGRTGNRGRCREAQTEDRVSHFSEQPGRKVSLIPSLHPLLTALFARAKFQAAIPSGQSLTLPI